ncbi:MAG: phosphoglycerate kinase, partial [Myxococcales bacterium]|nr:phosphoglycerate kinase [Myxococcales bacterium]
MAYLDGIKSIEELELSNQRVFIRVDFNVPLDKQQQITDDERIRAAIPTIQYALDAGAKVILASHLGRPKGKVAPEYSLEPCGARLAELMKVEVHMPDDCIGDAPRKVIQDLRAGQVCLLENLRFHAEEEANEEGFIKELGELCDVYVSDAFGAVHRAHASTAGLPRIKPERGMGFLVKREIASLARVVDSPARPFVAVLGGAKVADKIAVIESLMQKCDAICIGGAMANTLLAAQGHKLQASRVEEDWLARGRTLLEQARDRKVDILLPKDVVVATSLEAQSGKTVGVGSIPADHMALDVGPETLELFGARIAKAQTIFWNGPMGLFENPAFASGTQGIAQRV